MENKELRKITSHGFCIVEKLMEVIMDQIIAGTRSKSSVNDIIQDEDESGWIIRDLLPELRMEFLHAYYVASEQFPQEGSSKFRILLEKIIHLIRNVLQGLEAENSKLPESSYLEELFAIKDSLQLYNLKEEDGK